MGNFEGVDRSSRCRRASTETGIKLLAENEDRVTGVRNSWDMLARNSDLYFASDVKERRTQRQAKLTHPGQKGVFEPTNIRKTSPHQTDTRP
jgi:hypothetical protein